MLGRGLRQRCGAGETDGGGIVGKCANWYDATGGEDKRVDVYATSCYNIGAVGASAGHA